MKNPWNRADNSLEMAEERIRELEKKMKIIQFAKQRQ